MHWNVKGEVICTSTESVSLYVTSPLYEIDPLPDPFVGSKNWIVSVLPVFDSCHAGIVSVAAVRAPVVEFSEPARDAGVGSAVAEPPWITTVPDVSAKSNCDVAAEALLAERPTKAPAVNAAANTTTITFHS